MVYSSSMPELKCCGRVLRSSVVILLAACASGAGSARADQLMADITAAVPKSWTPVKEAERNTRRLYVLPNGCGVEVLYGACGPTGACEEEVYGADGLTGVAAEDASGCCGSDGCVAKPVKGSRYTCDVDADAVVPPSSERAAWVRQHRRDGSWIVESVAMQFFFATKQPKVGTLGVTLGCPAAAFKEASAQLETFVKSIKHPRDVGAPPKPKTKPKR
jgi:hypothetical protein